MTNKLNLKELQEVYNKREIAKIPGFMYAEFVEEIVVLRLANVPYRIISERLNLKVKSRKIEPPNLRMLYLKWFEIGFINQDMIDKLQVIADNLKSNKYDEDEQDVHSSSSTSEKWSDI